MSGRKNTLLIKSRWWSAPLGSGGRSREARLGGRRQWGPVRAQRMRGVSEPGRGSWARLSVSFPSCGRCNTTRTHTSIPFLEPFSSDCHLQPYGPHAEALQRALVGEGWCPYHAWAMHQPRGHPVWDPQCTISRNHFFTPLPAGYRVDHRTGQTSEKAVLENFKL